MLQELINQNKPLIGRYDVAKALQKRHLLRHTKVIQISSNIKYVSIQFNTSQVMETSCTETLIINKNCNATFLPDFKKRLQKQNTYKYISFLNVPSEAEEEERGSNPRYPTKIHNGIEYYTGTRAYRVFNMIKYIPRLKFLFGRQIKCIYTGQPENTGIIEQVMQLIKIANHQKHHQKQNQKAIMTTIKITTKQQ